MTMDIQFKDVQIFVDEQGTVFLRKDGSRDEWEFIYFGETDECTTSQLTEWGVKIMRIIK